MEISVGEDKELISLVDKQEIILAHLRDGISQRKLERTTGICRKTISKYIKDYEKKKAALLESPSTELIVDLVEPPKYNSAGRMKRKLDSTIIRRIDEMLLENQVKRETGRRKNQKKKIDIFETLQEEGFDIGYSTVCNYVRDKLQEGQEAFIRQEYSPGEVCEFDWGTVNLVIGGRSKPIQMAAFASAYGNYREAALYHHQKMEQFLDSHVSFFERIMGVYRIMVYDNMKVAVKKFVTRFEKEPTEELLKLSLYYGFQFRFCNIESGNEKGHVEKGVEYIRRKVFSRRDHFETLEEANEFLRQELGKLNLKVRPYNHGLSHLEKLEEERPHLIPLMPRYDTARTSELRVSKYSVVSIDENKYSVPDHLVNRFVFAKIYPGEIRLYHENALVATHVRKYGKHQWSIQIEHFLRTLKKKPGALANSTAIKQAQSELQQIYNLYYTEKPKEFLDLLEIIREKSLTVVQEAIAELERLSPIGVDTEKIKFLCSREHRARPEEKEEGLPSIIEQQSMIMLTSYGHLLHDPDYSFQKETVVI